MQEHTQSENDLELKGFRDYLKELEKERKLQKQRLFEIEELQIMNDAYFNAIKYSVLKDFKKFQIKIFGTMSLKLIHPLTGRPINFISCFDVCELNQNKNEAYEEALEKAEQITKKLFPTFQTIIF
jgi:hypothetical protein